MNVAARNTMIQRKCRLRATIQRMSVRPELELGPVNLWQPVSHYLRAVLRAFADVHRAAGDTRLIVMSSRWNVRPLTLTKT